MKRNLLYHFLLRFFTPLARFMFWVRYKGLENIPKSGNLIVCSNHKSVFDPFLVAMPVSRQIHFMAKKELFTDHGKLASRFLQCVGTFPVRRNSGDLGSVRTAERILQSGGVVGIFPQGGCVFDDSPFQPKAGVAFLAERGGAPVLPVSIYCRGLLRPFKKITIRFGSLLFADHGRKDRKVMAKNIADKINRMLGERY